MAVLRVASTAQRKGGRQGSKMSFTRGKAKFLQTSNDGLVIVLKWEETGKCMKVLLYVCFLRFHTVIYYRHRSVVSCDTNSWILLGKLLTVVNNIS